MKASKSSTTSDTSEISDTSKKSKTFLVGGAVRDLLLNLSITEKDWVVVGSTREEMLSKGFIEVGLDFPVFLHPKTKEEYALARVERKIKGGYKGFECETQNVTLEEDLLRRDLTINAMALDVTGINKDLSNVTKAMIIDPYHGIKDIELRVLRHVSDAFIEDPVRVLRLARFLARFKHLGFSVAPDTTHLMNEMTKRGELNFLVSERVLQEWQKAFTTLNPECFYIALQDAKALSAIFPELVSYYSELIERSKVTFALGPNNELDAFTLRFIYHLGCMTEADFKILAKRLKFPGNIFNLTLLLIKYNNAFKSLPKEAEQRLELLLKLDGLRKPQRFTDFLMLCQLPENINHQWLLNLNALKSVDLSDIATLGLKQDEVLAMIKKRRLTALEAIK